MAFNLPVPSLTLNLRWSDRNSVQEKITLRLSETVTRAALGNSHRVILDFKCSWQEFFGCQSVKRFEGAQKTSWPVRVVEFLANGHVPVSSTDRFFMECAQWPLSPNHDCQVNPSLQDNLNATILILAFKWTPKFTKGRIFPQFFTGLSPGSRHPL